jgi:hypothetical protein
MALTRIIAATMFLTFTAGLAHGQSTGDALSRLQTAVACAPPPSLAPSPVGLPYVIGGQDVVPRLVFGANDLLLVSGGMSANLELGQRYFVRRPMHSGHGLHGDVPIAQTLGWIRMVAINPQSAVAIVEVACESMGAGDYLEPFTVPQVPAGADRVDTSGTPDFAASAQVVFGSDRHRIGAPGDFMLIDRGTGDGLTAGTRLAVYRDLGVANQPLAALGEAIVISTAETTALIRVLTSRTAVETGDYVVPRKP